MFIADAVGAQSSLVRSACDFRIMPNLWFRGKESVPHNLLMIDAPAGGFVINGMTRQLPEDPARVTLS